MALLTENDEPKDKEYGDFTAEMYAEGHSFFTYMSDNADSLSSCCFSGDTEVDWKFWNDVDNVQTWAIGKLYELSKHCKNRTILIRHKDDFVPAVPVCLDGRPMFKVSCIVDGKLHEYKMTDNHINVTNHGDKRTDELTMQDCLVYWIDGKEKYGYIKSIVLCDGVPDNVYCVECEDKQNPYFTLADGLMTHNCRLRNEIQDNGFSYTLGAGGVSTGSKSVLTINLNRCIQYAMKKDGDYHAFLNEVIELCHKVQIAYNENLKDLQSHGMLPLFDEGYINIGRQYLTIGINGLVEAAEYLGYAINDNVPYKSFVQDVLGIIQDANMRFRNQKEGVMFNCEMIPAENVGVKHAKWDKEDGYEVPRDCYNSYFYIVEDKSINVLDKFKLHGKPYIEHLTGGSALHMNLEEHLTKEQYKQLLHVAAKEGCNYFTFNIPNTMCNDCGHIDKRYLKRCPKCGSENVDYLTRII